MSLKLKSTRNNPDPTKFKKEPKEEEEEVQIIEILEHTAVESVHYNSIQIPFKSEANNYLISNPSDYSVLSERIKQLESENKSLLNTIRLKSSENDLLKQNEIKIKAKINELNEMIEVKSNEINDLKLKLDKYKNDQSEIITKKIIVNLEPESTFKTDHDFSTDDDSNKSNDKSESTFDSDHYMSANESTDNDDDDDDSYENDKEPTNKVVYFCSFLL